MTWNIANGNFDGVIRKCAYIILDFKVTMKILQLNSVRLTELLGFFMCRLKILQEVFARQEQVAYLEQGEICFQHRDGERATFSVFIKRKEVGNDEERIIKRDGKWC